MIVSLAMKKDAMMKKLLPALSNLRLLFLMPVVLMVQWSALWAQAPNNSCTEAIALDNVSSWCSAVAEFSNVGATNSGLSASCFPNNQVSNDVWFSFVAEATDVNISVVGNVAINAGGTLQTPQFALYQGDCSSLTQVACISDAFNNNAVQLQQSLLQIGQTYYIQVSARSGRTGSFRICINNFNAVPDPSGDCFTGVILCNKEPFTVPFVSGVGNNPNEIVNVGCNSAGCNITESSSTWYKWTCDQPGTLTFVLNPLNPADDLDFVLYELPAGINNCTGKIDIRCMASGENVGAPFAQWAPCTGATGLSLSDTDLNETCGCQTGNNNFLRFVDMEAGKSYALVVNNFSQSGVGFTVEFGGTGTFLGPTADFTTNIDTVCVGDPITFSDASTFAGGLSGWEWNFGLGASPAAVNARGPHQVVYNRPGLKSIVLRVRTQDGCVVTKVRTVFVRCCDEHFDIKEAITGLSCPGDASGAIELEVTSSFAPYEFAWSNGQNTQNISSLEAGMYRVTITDASTCSTEAEFTVGGPPPLQPEPIIGMPTCNGGVNGSITLNASGGTAPYEFSWEGGPFTTSNSLFNLPVGDYSLRIRDANGCEEDFVIPVRELELTLDPTVNAAIDPSCTGFSDGAINVIINNGLPPYLYDFNNGNGFVGQNSLSSLSAGTYLVEVQDANLCRGSFTFELADPPLLEVGLSVVGISCFGERDGVLTALPSGGVGGYNYLWSNGQNTASIGNLDEGGYAVTLTDANGCVAMADTLLLQPPALFVNITSLIDLICFGEPDGLIGVAGEGGVPPYEFSIGGQSFQLSPVFDGLFAGNYTITIMDANGCTATVAASLTQPPQLLVDAGPDQRIRLGYTANLNAFATASPVTFSWLPADSLSCIDCPNPIARPVLTTTYTVTAMDENGCLATDEMVVFIVQAQQIYIPDAFSPNGDGRNDSFTVYAGPGVRRIQELKVFNRWGGLVFENSNFPPNDPALGWDGTVRGEPAQIGVYAYYALVEYLDGASLLFKGDVTIVR
jgi:gliding motility-associated-like protein